jgi:hypothetical protein
MEKKTILLLISVLLCINLVYAQSEDDYFSLKWKAPSKGSVVYVDITDLEDDGIKEIVVGSSEQTIIGASGWVDVLDMEGNSKWRVPYALPGAVAEVFVDDLEGDGEKEIIAAVFSRIHVIAADGQRKWERTPRYGYNIKSLYVDDINNNGEKEIIVGAGSGSVHNELYVINAQGETLWSSRVSGEIHAIASGDLDGDGLKEVLIGCYGRGSTYNRQAAMHVFNSTGEERFNYGTERGVASILVDDIDSDGVREILVGSYQELYILDNGGKDLWQYTTNGLIREIISEDVDNDTVKEIVLGSNNVYSLDEDGSLEWENAVGPEVYDMKAVDLNNDGSKEIIVGSDSGYVLESDGEALWDYPTGNIVKSVCVGDLGNDGYLELALGSADKNVYLFQSETYAKREEAYSNHRIAENNYNKKNFELAREYALKAKGLYSEIEDDKGVRDVETLISKIGSDSERLGQEKTQADAYYNTSVSSYLDGDYINASSYAQKAKYKYSYLKEYEAVDKCNELINNSARFLEIDAQEYLQNSSDIYDTRDYELALEYARKARTNLEWIDKVEDIQDVDELLARIYYGLAEKHNSARDFKNASTFIQKSLYTYRCLENETPSAEIGCNPDNAPMGDITALSERMSGETYEDSRFREELLKIRSLVDNINREDTGNPVDRISDLLGSNALYILVGALVLIVLALLAGSLYLMSKRQIRPKEATGLRRLEKKKLRGDSEEKFEKKKIDEYITRSIDKIKKDRFKGDGLPIKKTMRDAFMEEL